MHQPDFSPAADRNKQPLLDVLRQVLPERGSALEIASGTGQHVAWFAARLPQWTWQATCAALMRGSVQRLAPGGVLITYGPYLEDGVPTSAGNLAFDHSLRMKDATWGIRRREDVAHEAVRAGLQLTARHAMSANNLLLVWRQASPP